MPGEGDPDTEVVFVGEGPGYERGPRGPAVRRAAPAACSSSCSARIGWRREDVFITNVVKCRPPGNRDPRARRDRRLRAVPPAPARGRSTRPLVVTLGRYSMGRVHARARGSARPTARSRPADPATGARDATGRSRCTTRRPRSATPDDRARRATRTWPRIPARPARRRARRAERPPARPRRAATGDAATVAGRRRRARRARPPRRRRRPTAIARPQPADDPTS